MFALILKSNESNPDYWICYQLSKEIEDIRNLNCYGSGNLYLSKEDYEAQLLEDLVRIPSCRTGDEAEFAIYQFVTPINLSNQFQFS